MLNQNPVKMKVTIELTSKEVEAIKSYLVELDVKGHTNQVSKEDIAHEVRDQLNNAFLGQTGLATHYSIVCGDSIHSF